MTILGTTAALAGQSKAAPTLPVFPCVNHPGSERHKRPLVKDFANVATTAPQVIEAWAAQYPGCLWGVPTGTKSGIYVLDIDVKNGVNGWQTIQAHGWIVPPTPAARTPSGGSHLLFRALMGMHHKTDAGSNGGIGPGLDRRGDGGYIIWWGADLNFPLSDPPEWMMAGARAAADQMTGVPVIWSPEEGDRIIERALTDVRDAPKGERNSTLNLSAFRLGQLLATSRGRHPTANEAELISRLGAAAAECGLPPNEAARTIRSGIEGGKAKPELAPEGFDGRQIPLPPGAYATREEAEKASIGRLQFANDNLQDLPKFRNGPAQVRQWIVQNLIPASATTLLYAPGATGKSLALLQLAASCASIKASANVWLGKFVPHCRVTFFTCEDDEDEINRRLADILKQLGIHWSDVADYLDIVPMKKTDLSAVLAFQNRNNIMQPTATFDLLKRRIARHGSSLVILDTLADIFAGNENDRTLAKQFIKLVESLASGCTFIIAGHPSKSGMANGGDGFSGSTGWENAVRARLYMERLTDRDGNEPDPDLRVLSDRKSNYGRKGASNIKLRYRHGVFVNINHDIETKREASTEELLLDEKVKKHIYEHSCALKTLSPNRSCVYAPTVLADHADFRMIANSRQARAKHIKDAIDRLEARGEIKTENFGTGKNRKMTYVLVQEETHGKIGHNHS